MSTEAPARSESKQPGLLSRTFHNYWLGMAAVWFMGTLAACCMLYLLVKPMYRAYSVLRVEPLSASLYGITTNSETFDSFMKTQVELITSPNVLTAAGTNAKAANLRRIQAARDVVQELKNVVKVIVPPGTTLIEVSMTSPDSYEAAVIVNAVVDAYLATNEEWVDGMTRKQIKSLEEYLQDLRSQTDELERRWKKIVAKGDLDFRELEAFQKNRLNPDFQNGAGITIEVFKAIRSQILSIHLELVQAEAWAEALKGDATKAGQSDPKTLDQVVKYKFVNDPEVMELIRNMMAYQEKLDGARIIGKSDEGPAVRAAAKHLDSLKTNYDQLWEEKSKALRSKIELTSVVVGNPELREAETKVRELQVKQAALEKVAKDLQVGNHRLANDQVDIQLLMDQRAGLKGMQEAVQRRLEQLRYEARGESRVRKVNDAVASTKPVSDNRLGLLAIAPFAMMFVAFSLFLVVEAGTSSNLGPVPMPVAPVKSHPTLEV